MPELTLLKPVTDNGVTHSAGEDILELNGEKARRLIESGFAKLKEKTKEELELERKDRAALREHDLKLNYDFFDEKGRAVPQQITSYLKEVFTFKAMRDNRELYYFNGAFYELGAETIVEEKCNELLDDKSKTHTVNETIALIKYGSYVNRTEADKNILCLKNGLFNMETGELGEFDPIVFVTRQLPVEFDPKADCPSIKKFISEIVREQDVPAVQEWVGYCMHPGYEIQKAALFIGEGANGKSTLLGLIKAFLGAKNISTLSLQAFDNNKFAPARMFGKMANLYPDLPDAALHRTGTFKMLTGGDTIQGEKKFIQDSFDFTNTAKLLFSCNKVPETMDRTPAFFRRWVFINFPYKFEGKNADKNILKKLITQEELSGFFNWAFKGLKRLLKQGDFTNTKSTEEMADHYERLSSPVAAFVKDRVESGVPYTIDSAGAVLKAPFYKDFVEYCNENSLPACASNTFGKDLPRYLPSVMAGKIRQDGTLQHCWRGISFVINEKEKEEPQKKLK